MWWNTGKIVIGENKKVIKNEVAVVGYIVCWLMREATTGQIFPTKQNMNKIFLPRLPLGRSLTKTLPCKVSQKICRSKTTLNCKSHHACIKLKHTQHKWCEKLGCRLDWRVVIINYVCQLWCISVIWGAESLLCVLNSQFSRPRCYRQRRLKFF